ncbi:Wzz/FepE/Etk N-terminal domain-containing protein [Photobacterium sp. DA100]|uniref:Wzz/FepE/Etk N-terminal domain-containing protein n=1 Tax=Photobacterium sp. DA100 TaxID=3027472 RepID=UPI002479B302|nr:Wzz/FepE/Etk N-terminal domain-containing protein [Photobacterium sp. DA100]WEM41552.1 Wzz/FepE/Etk N-terminal domain-containing protein [Photobacterium sp. DA100]
MKSQDNAKSEAVRSSKKEHSLYKEIDFLLILKTLWHEKITVLVVTGLFAVAAVLYVNTVEETWTSKAKVLPPLLYDYADLQKQTAKLLPAFETAENAANTRFENPFTALLESKELLKNFIYEFNSLDNKKEFLSNNETFKKYVNEHNNSSSSTKELQTWSNKFSAAQERNEKNVYNLAFESFDSTTSTDLLNKYIEFTNKKVIQKTELNIDSLISQKRAELDYSIKLLQTQIQSKLETEKKRTQLALQVAEAAGINTPINTIAQQNDEIFSIHIGSKALSEKYKILSKLDLDDLNIFEPRIKEYTAKITMLDNYSRDTDASFKTYRFMNEVSQPLYKDSPKRGLIVLIATLFGIVVSIFIALLKRFLTVYLKKNR